MNTVYVSIHWSASSIEEARYIAKILVEKRWVACAHLIPETESIFLWKNQLEIEKETSVVFKTKSSFFESIKNFILQEGKYEVPEIVVVPIIEGNPAYFAWIDELLKEY